MNDRNIIPTITHPYGSAWKQPSTAGILIDDTHAVMTVADFQQLEQYDCSIPSGVYEGKMWKCKRGDITYLCWYGPGRTASSCSVNNRKIILV